MSVRATATRQPALVASLPEPVPVSAHAGDGQAQPIATPSYRSAMRRAHAIRMAREEWQRAYRLADSILADAEAEADRIHLAEMREINAEMCRAWEERRKEAA